MKNISYNVNRLKKFLFCIYALIGLSSPSNATANRDYQKLTLLESSINDAESQFADLVPEAKKQIRWFNNERVRSEYAIVYLHGFSASRQEISPVTERVADLLSANVFYPRLTGHGRSADAMRDGSVEKWQQDTRNAYATAQQLGDKIIVISTSTGATLATWLAAQTFSSALVANVMVSPNFGIASRSGEIVRWSWGLRLAKWMNGDYYSFEPQNEAHRLFWTERYPLEALVPMVKLVDDVVAMDKSTIRIPQLIIYSPNDQVVNVDRIIEIASEFSQSPTELVPFTTSQDPSQHVLAGDACSPESNDAMVELIANYLKSVMQ